MPSPAPPHEREAMLWTGGDNRHVDCALCAHRCRIAPGRTGLCRARENRGGTLTTLVYGRLIAAHVDPIEKKPLYHVLPGTRSYSIATAGCNFRCDFCQNANISQIADMPGIPGQFTPPEAIVRDAVRSKCASIAYTYTEPTIFFELAHDTARLAHEAGLKNVFVTNGYQTAEAVGEMIGLIDAANVDLKAFSDDFYRTHCKARLQPVLDTIRRMHEDGIFVEVTTLLIPGENDAPDELSRIAEFIVSVSADMPWHVSAYHPAYKFDHRPRTTPQAILKALEIGRAAGLRYLYAGNVPGSGCEDTVCPHCGVVVIGRMGYLLHPKNLKGNRCGGCGAALPILL